MALLCLRPEDQVNQSAAKPLHKMQFYCLPQLKGL